MVDLSSSFCDSLPEVMENHGIDPKGILVLFFSGFVVGSFSNLHGIKISWDWDIWGFIIGIKYIKCEILMILMGFCELPSGK